MLKGAVNFDGHQLRDFAQGDAPSGEAENLALQSTAQRVGRVGSKSPQDLVLIIARFYNGQFAKIVFP